MGICLLRWCAGWQRWPSTYNISPQSRCLRRSASCHPAAGVALPAWLLAQQRITYDRLCGLLALSLMYLTTPLPLQHVKTLTCLQEDLERVAAAGRGRVDITVGSALDIFGGKLPYADVVAWHKAQQQAVAV